jgi:aspartyl-tRNA synthetase
VKARDPELVNPKLPTGEIEVFIRDMEVLGGRRRAAAAGLRRSGIPEETRLKYRYLDLRREAAGQHDAALRRGGLHPPAHVGHGTSANTRRRSSPPLRPEGARDFLVPSRLHPGKFYALPQAPQQFKQLIMVSGFDKYFQIAPCFRDEDPRADRSPTDFYQLDMEMSFVEQEDVFHTIEPVLKGVFENSAAGAPVIRSGRRFPTRTRRSGTAPTSPTCATRSRCRCVRAFRGLRLRHLRQDPGAGGHGGPRDPGARRRQPQVLRPDEFLPQGQGLPGMGYIFWREARAAWKRGARWPRTSARTDRGDPPAAAPAQGRRRLLPRRQAAELRGRRGPARDEIGRELGLIDEPLRLRLDRRLPDVREGRGNRRGRFLAQPVFDAAGRAGRARGRSARGAGLPVRPRLQRLRDVSGAIRNHKPEIMFKAFELAGYGEDEVRKRFGGMVNAFRYGAPPHGGCAAGIDRIVMLLADTANIREVILFPMNQRAEDLMMNAPSEPKRSSCGSSAFGSIYRKADSPLDGEERA